MAIKLKDIHLFEGIDLEYVWMLIDNSRRENYYTWDTILKQWEESNGSAYIIQEWEVKVEIKGKEIAVLKEWEIFWEIALITDEPRIATVKANTDIVLLKIDKNLLHTIIKKFKNWKDIQEILMKRISNNLKNN
jgi:CRP-like cAMP-binding protein